LIIPEINTGFSTAGKYHSTDACANKRVDFRELLDDSAISKLGPELEYNDHEFGRLLKKAVEMISNAKRLHDELETFYIRNIDFEGIVKKQDETVQKILSYA